MSNYKKEILNPLTHRFGTYWFIDDYFGNHRYGIELAKGGSSSRRIVIEARGFSVVTKDSVCSVGPYLMSGECYARYLRHHDKYSNLHWGDRPKFKFNNKDREWYAAYIRSISPEESTTETGV